MVALATSLTVLVLIACWFPSQQMAVDKRETQNATRGRRSAESGGDGGDGRYGGAGIPATASQNNSVNVGRRQVTGGNTGDGQGGQPDEGNGQGEQGNGNGGSGDGGDNGKVTRRKRSAAGTGDTWPNGKVQYEFEGLGTDMVDKVNQAINVIETQTCIEFISADESDWSDDVGYVKIKAHTNPTECSSNNGYVAAAGESQEINLGSACDLKTILHEFCHTLGLVHELRRLDYASYVTVNTGNINGGSEDNFNQWDNLNLLTGYDFSSVMQYGKTQFSNGNGDTIKLKEGIYKNTQDGVDNLSGSVRGMQPMNILSFRDKAALNKLYNCKGDSCADNCLNGGYMDKYCECKCTLAYVGPTCGTYDTPLVHDESICGPSELEATWVKKTLRPPLDDNGDVKSGVSCYWKIYTNNADKNVVVALTAWNVDQNKCRANPPGTSTDMMNNNPIHLYLYLYGYDVDVYPISCRNQDRSSVLPKPLRWIDWARSDGQVVYVDWIADTQFINPATGEELPTNSKGFVLQYTIRNSN